MSTSAASSAALSGSGTGAVPAERGSAVAAPTRVVQADLIWGTVSGAKPDAVQADLIWGTVSGAQPNAVPADLIWGPSRATVTPVDLIWGLSQPVDQESAAALSV